MALLTPSEIPTTEPEIVYAGQTIKWTKSLSSYPAGTYTLKYYLSGPASVTLTGSQYESTTDHLISVTAATSAAYTYGIYQWQAYAETGAGASLEKYFVGSGFITIKTPAGKTHAKRMVDLYETALEALTIGRAKSYSIAGRSFQAIDPMDMADLRRERNLYRAEYQAEIDKEQLALGGGVKSNRLYSRL